MKRLSALVFLSAALLLTGCETMDGKRDANDPTASRNSAGNQGARTERRVDDPNSGEPRQAEPKERARIRTELAFAYFQERQMAVALDEVRTALRDDPNSAQAYNVLGLIQMDLGDTVRADEAFTRALRIEPNSPDVNNNYGWFLCRTKRERQGIPYFLNALKDPLYQTPSKPYTNAGLCSLQIDDLAAAEGYFSRAFSLDPGNPMVAFQLARIYFKREDLPRADFYTQRLLGDGLGAPPQGLWLALNIARKRNDASAENSYAAQLKRRFPDSEEARRLGAGQFE